MYSLDKSNGRMYVSRHVVFNEEVFPEAISSLTSSSPSPAASSEFQSFSFEPDTFEGCPTSNPVEHTDTVASGGSPASHSSESNESVGVFPAVEPNTEQQTVGANHRNSSSTDVLGDVSESSAARLSATLEQSVDNDTDVVEQIDSSVQNFPTVAFSDADWGSDLDDRRSVSGYCTFIGNHLLSWSSRKQRSVSRSTAEAEFRSLADAASELMWLKAILVDMHATSGDIPIVWSDNTSAVAMAANPVMHAKTKHVELDLFFVREKVLSHELLVNYVPAADQVADVFTKPISISKFEEFRHLLCVRKYADLLSLEKQGE
ncbi:hypothetical protein GQ457_06G004450 [Hibiscus cannabinus]